MRIAAFGGFAIWCATVLAVTVGAQQPAKKDPPNISGAWERYGFNLGQFGHVPIVVGSVSWAYSRDCGAMNSRPCDPRPIRMKSTLPRDVRGKPSSFGNELVVFSLDRAGQAPFLEIDQSGAEPDQEDHYRGILH